MKWLLKHPPPGLESDPDKVTRWDFPFFYVIFRPYCDWTDYRDLYDRGQYWAQKSNKTAESRMTVSKNKCRDRSMCIGRKD